MLDKSQQILVEQNHNLIYGFAQKRNIDINEYYGLLAISLCKAAEAYQENKGKFSTFAYMVMGNDLKKYWRTMQNQKSIPSDMIVSYDSHDESCESSYLDNMAADDTDVNFQIQYRCMLEQMNETERIICQMLMDGAKQSDIVERLGITKNQYTMAKKKIKEKYHNKY